MIGLRYKCLVCEDVQFCEKCYGRRGTAAWGEDEGTSDRMPLRIPVTGDDLARWLDPDVDGSGLAWLRSDFAEDTPRFGLTRARPAAADSVSSGPDSSTPRDAGPVARQATPADAR